MTQANTLDLERCESLPYSTSIRSLPECTIKAVPVTRKQGIFAFQFLDESSILLELDLYFKEDRKLVFKHVQDQLCSVLIEGPLHKTIATLFTKFIIGTAQVQQVRIKPLNL